MKTFFFLIVLAGLCPLIVRAQDKCVITSDKLPAAAELHGFRLGMTMEEVRSRVPPIVFGRLDPYGISKTSINPSFDSRFDQTSFAGVRTVSLTFLDGRLMELWIGYDGAFKWQKFDEFVGGISKSLNLPNAWQAKARGQQISCDGLQIAASMLAGSPSLRLTDTAGEKTLISRRQAAADAAEETEALPTKVSADKHSKLFYPANCAGADGIGAENLVIFNDAAEALKAGYKLAKNCQ
ncbi:MAG: hypothetical protein QOE77_3112 [Blastocatellia bacterium]|nr:hypothetical protein [Blastocatellia bacterium]